MSFNGNKDLIFLDNHEFAMPFASVKNFSLVNEGLNISLTPCNLNITLQRSLNSKRCNWLLFLPIFKIFDLVNASEYQFHQLERILLVS